LLTSWTPQDPYQQPPQGAAAQQQQQAQQTAPQGQQQGQQPQQGAQQGAAANMAAQNQPNFVFALSPALINPGPIDYSTTKGIKLWRGRSSHWRKNFSPLSRTDSSSSFRR